MKRKFALFLCIFILFQVIGCENNNEKSISKFDEKQYKSACNTPFEPYPETIKYTLGKLAGVNNSNMPSGDTYENNAYTRYLKKELNIQNIDKFEGTDIEYDNMVSMAISENDIPDIMVVDDYEQLKLLVQNDMIEDLSAVYDRCASRRIKDMYLSYGKNVFNNVTFNGKLMALPDTNIENGPNMLWLRKDWMDKLGLDAPKTLQDAEYIISQFIEKDPGGNGKGNTVGLVCSPEITSENGYSYMTQADIIFANFNSYPRQWIVNDKNEVEYGSVQPQSKEALKHMRKLYEEGILDRKFLLRGQNNIEELIINGQCGSFFGLWWAPNNPLMDSRRKNRNAQWQPYMISTDEDGNTNFAAQNPTYKYVVVRKGYEHPELVMKINNVLFNYYKASDSKVEEIKEYYAHNVDPTARPLAMNVDYMDALTQCYNNITDAVNKKKNPENLQLLENSYYEQCRRYLNDPDNASLEDWAAYTSRITASSLIAESKIHRVKAVFAGQTDTMNKSWWKLKNLETQAYLKIITGEEPIDYFDEFVDEWYKQGGEQIINEVNNERLLN